MCSVPKNRCTTHNGQKPRKIIQMKEITTKKNEVTSNSSVKLAKRERERQKQAEKSAREGVECKKAKEALKAIKLSDKRSAKNTYEAGKALQTIKADKLYKFTANEEKFRSFKKYVGETFKISEQYAYMLINAAKVWDILSDAGVTLKDIPEKLLRKLTSLLHDENKIVEIWKVATKGKADKIPTDKELCDAVAASKPEKQPTDKSNSEILNDPNTKDREIIKILLQVSNGKAHLTEDELETLKGRLSDICDNAVIEND